MSEESTSAMSRPCVKGSVFLMSLQGVKRLVRDGRLSREEVEFELQADDLRLLDEKIVPEGWYPVASFDRFASIVIEARSDGDPSYLAEQGESATAEVLGSQAYRAFIDAARMGQGATRPGPSMLTMVRLMLNFSRWELDSESMDGRSFELRVSDAGDLPETLRYAGQGFIQSLATICLGEPSTVTSERLDQETILYRGGTRG
jgi:hypothetical protein